MLNQETIDAAVKNLFRGIKFTEEPSGLYDPLRYMISIGGKRIRPTLCLIAYSLYKDELTAEILEPAAGIEVFHSFTLIHDDIMDRSPLRRGVDTVWKKVGLRHGYPFRRRDVHRQLRPHRKGTARGRHRCNGAILKNLGGGVRSGSSTIWTSSVCRPSR